MPPPEPADPSRAHIPARGLAVVTCMDCRIDTLGGLGLELGDAHVIRNAGGLVAEDALRSLALSHRMMGTREVRLIQHTRCGLLGLDDEEVLASIEADTGRRPSWRPGGFADLAASVRAGLATIAAEPALAGMVASGYVLDIDTGSLEEVSLSP